MEGLVKLEKREFRELLRTWNHIRRKTERRCKGC